MQFTEIKEQLKNEALVEEIYRFFEEHNLIMFVDSRIKNLGGQETPTFGISFYNATEYLSDIKCKPLYDTESAYINVLDFDFDYPIWNQRGAVNGKADLRLIIKDNASSTKRVFSIREKVLGLPPYDQLDDSQAFDRGLNLDHQKRSPLSHSVGNSNATLSITEFLNCISDTSLAISSHIKFGKADISRRVHLPSGLA